MASVARKLPATQNPRSRLDTYVGLRICTRRTSLGWTQRELAARLQIGLDQVKRIECGLAPADASQLSALAQALDVNVGFFYLDANEPAEDAALCYTWSRRFAGTSATAH